MFYAIFWRIHLLFIDCICFYFTSKNQSDWKIEEPDFFEKLKGKAGKHEGIAHVADIADVPDVLTMRSVGNHFIVYALCKLDHRVTLSEQWKHTQLLLLLRCPRLQFQQTSWKGIKISVPKILSRTAPPLPSSPALENVATNHKLKISECLRSHDATISFHRACIGAFIRLVGGIQGSDQLWCLLFGGGKSSGSLWRWILLPLPGLLQVVVFITHCTYCFINNLIAWSCILPSWGRGKAFTVSVYHCKFIMINVVAWSLINERRWYEENLQRVVFTLFVC